MTVTFAPRRPHALMAASILALVLTAPGQAQTMNAPPDVQALLLQMLQQRQAQMGLQAPAAPAARPATPAISEGQLAQQLGVWAKANGPFQVERFRDGYSINGQRILDPEGQITHYAVDSETGDHAYLVQTLPGQYVLKLNRYQTGAATTVAQVSRQVGTWLVETATGVKLNGNRLIVSPRGVMVARDNVFFNWTAGSGIQSYAAPDAYGLAAHQNGDIAGTGWVLLEKRIDAKAQEGGALGNTSLGALIGSVKRLGAAIGTNDSDTDYALFQLATGKLVPLGIAMEEKQAQFLSQCRAKNAWVSMCDRMDTIDSVYGQDGMANRSHYFWRVSWYRSSQGPVGVVMQNGITRIEAIQLNTDQRVQVFQRTLGIGDWTTQQTADGKIRVRAKLGFETATNDDVAALFSSQVSAR